MFILNWVYFSAVLPSFGKKRENLKNKLKPKNSIDIISENGFSVPMYVYPDS